MLPCNYPSSKARLTHIAGVGMGLKQGEYAFFNNASCTI